ncbi:N-acetylmuramoyl-L-alanine amidase, partial [bacterium]|nr:N-acetylmuramoyl-L-alanine amidase [bacterium]
MSNSTLISATVKAYEGNYTKGRSGRKIEKITIHHMAGVLSAQRCGELFQVVGRRGSAHYGIGNDGKIALYVNEADTAWADGNWDSNCTSVSIEVSNSATGGQWQVSDAALASLVKLVADIAKRNNLGTLVKGKNLT